MSDSKGFLNKAILWAAEHKVSLNGPGAGSRGGQDNFARGLGLAHGSMVTETAPPVPGSRLGAHGQSQTNCLCTRTLVSKVGDVQGSRGFKRGQLCTEESSVPKGAHCTGS